jgi:ribosomal protein S13
VSTHRVSKSRLKSTAEAVPWLLLVRGAMIISKRWNALSGNERVRLAELVRESRGRTSNLSVKQRLELRKIAGKLDFKGMIHELSTLWRGQRGRRGRRRR